MYCPFLTSQWKTTSSGENIATAQIQAARDGASIVNYFYTFYTIANGSALSPALACHFSLVYDLNVGEIWIHWQEDNDYYMEHLHSFFLRDQSQLLEARGLLKNILKHSVQDRLLAIKEAIPRFAQKRASFPIVIPTPPSKQSESSLFSRGPGLEALKFMPPRTPRWVTSEPAKKRSRTEDSVGN
jgi:hypothetical protein